MRLRSFQKIFYTLLSIPTRKLSNGGNDMIVPTVPGLFIIANYTENKFFFSYSSKNMYDVAKKHFYHIKKGGHVVNENLYELNKGLLLDHKIGYFHIITGDNIDNSVTGLQYPNIKNKLHQLIHAFKTFDKSCGYNGWSYEPRTPIYTDYGIYLITITNNKSGHRKFYIGKGDKNTGKGISARISSHKAQLSARKHPNKALQRDYNNPETYTIFCPLITFYDHEITSKELAMLEVHFISVFRSFLPQRGYNKNAKGLLVHTNVT